MIAREASVGKRRVGVERKDTRGLGVRGEVHGVDASERGLGGGVKRGGVGVGSGVNQHVVFGMAVRERARRDFGERHSFVELRLKEGARAERREGVALDVDLGHRPARSKRRFCGQEVYEICDALLFTVLVRNVSVGVHAKDARIDRVVCDAVRVRSGGDYFSL